MHESAKCYNGDDIVEVIIGDGYYVIRCKNSIYQIDAPSGLVTRLL